MTSSAESDPLPSQETTLDPSSVSQECEPESSHRECPICYHRLPLKKIEHVYHACCGEVICNGCVVGKQRTQLKEPQFKELGFNIEDTTPEEGQFCLIELFGMKIYVCPYCRAPPPQSEQELLQRIYDRIEIRNDRDYTIALNQLGTHYKDGECGLPQNLKKAEELFKEAYDLDDPVAAWNLYCIYDNEEKEVECLQRGEMLGSVDCIQELAIHAYDSGNMENFARLCVKSVRLGGDTHDINDLWSCYRHNLLSKDVVATTLRANQALKDEVTTKRRDFANRYEQFCDDADSDDDDSDGDDDDSDGNDNDDSDGDDDDSDGNDNDDSESDEDDDSDGDDDDDDDSDGDDDVMHRKNNEWE